MQGSILEKLYLKGCATLENTKWDIHPVKFQMFLDRLSECPDLKTNLKLIVMYPEKLEKDFVVSSLISRGFSGEIAFW